MTLIITLNSGRADRPNFALVRAHRPVTTTPQIHRAVPCGRPAGAPHRCLWRFRRRLLALLAAGCVTACATGDAGGKRAQMPQADALEGGATGTRQMVVAAHPLAAAAGLEILREGGSAVDAAIAAQMMLSLVEPQSSGIGGGGFLLHFASASGRIDAYDGRETAPAGAHAAMFLAPGGAPRPFAEAATGGLAVGVPGLLAMLEMAHREHGRLPWQALLQPAIVQAEAGFAVSPRLAGAIAGERAPNANAAARALFFHRDGTPLQAGDRLRNPELAQTLRSVAEQGAAAFYTGPIARAIVTAVRAAANPGSLSEADMAGYQARRRPAICAPYRRYRVCGMPPPSSGGIATLQILGLLETFDLPAMAPMSAAALHLFAEASRLAFADRDAYVADPEAVPVPTQALLDRGYLRQRARLIGERAMSAAEPGRLPDPAPDSDRVATHRDDSPCTTHLSIVDAAGNAVALTSSIEASFGARLVVHGFVLNNQLTDFAFAPEISGRPVSNRAGPFKRPRSSMAPTLVFDADDTLRLIVGSPGGARIIDYVAQTLTGVLDWRLGIQAAIDLPRIVNRNGPTELEPAPGTAVLQRDLEERGHTVQVRVLESGLHGIERAGGMLVGGADRRREGVVRAD